MPRGFALLVVIAGSLVACYADPDYGGTRFKCDDEHPCPAGQACVAGTCDGAGSAAGGSVACGAETCGEGEKCCADFIAAPRCLPIAEPCGGLAATCDGTEDCGGAPCCDNSTGGVNACGAGCAAVACREPSDCPDGEDCCFGLGGTNVPWGRCLVFCP